MRSAVVSPSSGPLHFDSDDDGNGIGYVKHRPGHLGLHPGPSEIYKGWRTARILCFLGLVNIACHFVLLHDVLKNNCLYSTGSIEARAVAPTFQSGQTLRPWSSNVMSAVFGDKNEEALESLWYFGKITYGNSTNVTTSVDGLDVDTTIMATGGGAFQLYTHLFPPLRTGRMTVRVEKEVIYQGEITLPKLPWDLYVLCLTPQDGFAPIPWSPCLLYEHALHAFPPLGQRVGLSYHSLPYPAIIVGDRDAGTVSALLCDTDAFLKTYNRSEFEISPTARLKCQSYELRKSISNTTACPLQAPALEVTCMTIRSCTNYIQGPLVCYVVWIIVFIAAWIVTEPYLCAVGQRCFARFNLNTHYLRYRTAHFWIAIVMLDLPVCLVTAYLSMQRGGGTPTIVTYIVVAGLGVNAMANGADVCVATWKDDPKKRDEEAAFSADVWRGEIELRDTGTEGAPDDAKSTATAT